VKEDDWNSLELPVPQGPTADNMRQIATTYRLIQRRRHRYRLQSRLFSEMKPSNEFASLDDATFVNKDFEFCEFTSLQKHDLNLVLQKRYALLN